MTVELVIFDCDGVLIDSERLAIRVEVEMLRELGWPLTEQEVIERFVGRSDREIHAAIESHFGNTLPSGWHERFEPAYREVFAAELAPVEGVPAALDEITLPSCIASSATHEHLRFTLGLTGLYGRFEGRIFSSEDVPRGKPAPDLFLYAARCMETEPERCLVVEDSRAGVQAARAAGMRVLAFASGLFADELLDGPDTVLFTHMSELPRLVEAAGVSEDPSAPPH